MDLKRYLLIGAIAVLSFMLLTEWVNFKQQRAEQAEAIAKQQTTTSSNSAATNTSAMPEANAVTETVATEDLPTLPAVSADTVSSETENNDAVQDSIITVTTDSLIVHIDSRGGDIVYTALPKHFAKIDTPDQPFVLLEQNPYRTYIAQSGLIGPDGIDNAKGRPQYRTEASSYTLADDQQNLSVELKFDTEEGVQITKQFLFQRGSYLIDVNYRINNNSSKAWQGSLFGQLKRDSSPDPSADSSGFGMMPYLGAATSTEEEPYKKIDFDEIEEKNYQHTRDNGWIAMIQHYFVSAWIPLSQQPLSYSTVYTRNNMHIIRFTSSVEEIAAGQQGMLSAQLYAGPKDQYRLEEISPGLELTVDYGWLWWIAQPLFWLLTQIHKLVGNWGFAIIGITLLVKALFFQLNATAYKSMANMRKVQPKLVALRERYADDKQKQSQEMMNLYRKEKINPLGGCLPILVQMPVFIALYWVLMESVELRHSPFILWINDLSVMDPYFVLPLIMGASMWVQQKLNPPPPDPMQAKIMQWMPVMFTFFFLFFPAGLVLYWVVNNLLSIAQQYVITRRIEREA